jgi:serine/threonine protein kinase
MNYLHSFRPPILHRDLKSANLLVDESVRTIKVADFGLARTRESTGAMTAQRGTFQWMAPEVILGQSYGEPADVYSFGIIMWECVARKL